MNENINTEIETKSDDELLDIDLEETDLNESDGEDILDAEDEHDEDFNEDFECDENGDLIIPTEEDDKDEEVGEDKSDEEEQGGSDVEENTVGDAEPAAVPDDKDKIIADLKRKLEAFESQGKDTLEKLGVESGDVMGGLVKLAAEAEETTPEEYLRKKAEKERQESALRQVQRIEFEKKMKADLEAIQTAYPETRSYDSVKNFPNFRRFGELRDLGLSPVEAYVATHPNEVRENVAAATKRQSLNDTKSHLKPAVGKTSKDTSITMSKKEMRELKDLFPNLTQKEIAKLYRDTKTK